MRLLVIIAALALFGVALVTSSESDKNVRYVTVTPPPKHVIDGTFVTVAIVIAEWLAGLIPYPGVSWLIQAIIEAFEPKPEDDYWEHIQTQVEHLVGEYINQHNIDQVLVYKDDLVDLLAKYDRAPLESDTYPSKNVMADAITTSIITNRYLVEASEFPSSMLLHFSDISSIHIMILKDAADSYSFEGQPPSRWWVDLSHELGHYIEYGNWLMEETVRWRDTMIECMFIEATDTCLAFEWAGNVCYDEYRLSDQVSGHTDSCVQLHETPTCTELCSSYEDKLNIDLGRYIYNRTGYAVDQWANLKVKSDQIAAMASRAYAPIPLMRQ